MPTINIKAKQTKKKITLKVKRFGDAILKKQKMKKHYPESTHDITISD